MNVFLILGYLAALVWFAYYVGRDSAGRGVLVFIVGIAAMQLLVSGPASFLESGCYDYGHAASDC